MHESGHIQWLVCFWSHGERTWTLTILTDYFNSPETAAERKAPKVSTGLTLSR